MIVHPAQQGSAAWLQARLGIPTASGLDNIITPATLRPSSSQYKYMCRLLAEWLLNRPLDDQDSGFLERGRVLEDEGRKWYELTRGVDVVQVGFCLTDDGAFGSSPDGLIGEDGGLEIKCPSAGVHVEYMLDPQSLVSRYRGQVQGGLYVTGRSWWDLLSYNPDLQPVVVRVLPDKSYQAAITAALPAFQRQLAEAKLRLKP
jgi:hypothetical protein